MVITSKFINESINETGIPRVIDDETIVSAFVMRRTDKVFEELSHGGLPIDADDKRVLEYLE